MVCGDFGMDPRELVRYSQINFGRTYYKPHPANTGQKSPVLSPKWTLEQIWSIANVAVGHSSTVRVEAELNGLYVYTTDPNHVCRDITDREKWLVDLSWAQWTFEQIVNGDFWEHLQ